MTCQENRRRWPRLHCDLPVRVLIRKPTRVTVLATRGTALNEGGMMVYTGFQLAIGERVELELLPPFSRLPVRVTGVVRNRRNYFYGLEFMAEGEPQRCELSLLRQTLKYHHITSPKISENCKRDDTSLNNGPVGAGTSAPMISES